MLVMIEFSIFFLKFSTFLLMYLFDINITEHSATNIAVFNTSHIQCSLCAVLLTVTVAVLQCC
jgi:hypothetical protein